MVAGRTELNQTKLSLQILVEFPKLDSFMKIKSFRKVTTGCGSEVSLVSASAFSSASPFSSVSFCSKKISQRLLPLSTSKVVNCGILNPYFDRKSNCNHYYICKNNEVFFLLLCTLSDRDTIHKLY